MPELSAAWASVLSALLTGIIVSGFSEIQNRRKSKIDNSATLFATWQNLYTAASETLEKAQAENDRLESNHAKAIALKDQEIARQQTLLVAKDAALLERDQKIAVFEHRVSELESQVVKLESQVKEQAAKIIELEAHQPQDKT